MSPEEELEIKEKALYKREDRRNKMYHSTNLLLLGGVFVLFFSNEYIKLYRRYSSYTEFKTAIQTVEKTRSLGFLLAIAVGIFFIWLGIRIRKSPIRDKPGDLP